MLSPQNICHENICSLLILSVHSPVEIDPRAVGARASWCIVGASVGVVGAGSDVGI